MYLNHSNYQRSYLQKERKEEGAGKKIHFFIIIYIRVSIGSRSNDQSGWKNENKKIKQLTILVSS